MAIPRTVAAETLDHLAPEDPAARRSRRDLARVHRAMGTRSIMARAWRELLAPDDAVAVAATAAAGAATSAADAAPPAPAPLRVLELGAGDGGVLLGVARMLGPTWPPVQLTLLDRQAIVTSATLSAYAAQGWRAQVQVIDVLDWANGEDTDPSGPAGVDAEPCGPARRWDLITTTLFLHHFDGPELDRLIAAVASRCNRFLACEPRRSWQALAGSHLVGVIGANAVTREDAVLSVHAGFVGDEISRRWPRAGGPWQLREAAVGLFSHCFSARRQGLYR